MTFLHVVYTHYSVISLDSDAGLWSGNNYLVKSSTHLERGHRNLDFLSRVLCDWGWKGYSEMYSTHSEGPKSTFHMSWAQSRRKFRTSRRQRNGLWPTSKVDHPLASPHSRKFSVLIWSWGLQSCHVCPVVEPRCLLRNLICCIRVFVWFGEYLPKLKDSNIETLIFRRNTSIVKM